MSVCVCVCASESERFSPPPRGVTFLSLKCDCPKKNHSISSNAGLKSSPKGEYEFFSDREGAFEMEINPKQFKLLPLKPSSSEWARANFTGEISRHFDARRRRRRECVKREREAERERERERERDLMGFKMRLCRDQCIDCASDSTRIWTRKRF